MSRVDFLILGGGWAGLLAAKELRSRGQRGRIVVLESSEPQHAGGLLKSSVEQGFTFDCGGPHILFSKFPESLEEITRILGPNAARFPRKSFVAFGDKFVPYPFENGLYQLPLEARTRIGSGLLQAAAERLATKDWVPSNFNEWIYGFFGDAMANEYLVPYNNKIWKRPLGELAADWVFTPGRVPTPSMDEIKRAMAGMESVGYREQAYFVYPRAGGIQSLYDLLLESVEALGIEVRFGSAVRNVERKEGDIVVNGQWSSSRVISTIPLPSLSSAMSSCPELGSLTRQLDYNRVLVVGVALKSETPDQTAVYVPEADIPIHRYTWMSYMNPRTDGASNLIAEVTIPKGDLVDTQILVTQVLDGLAKLKVIRKSTDVILTRAWLNEFGYPIYDRNRRGVMASIRTVLKRLGIDSVGRWGSWEYWNTDMVLRAVKATVDSILDLHAPS